MQLFGRESSSISAASAAATSLVASRCDGNAASPADRHSLMCAVRASTRPLVLAIHSLNGTVSGISYLYTAASGRPGEKSALMFLPAADRAKKGEELSDIGKYHCRNVFCFECC